MEAQIQSPWVTLEAPQENKRGKCGDRRQQTGLRIQMVGKQERFMFKNQDLIWSGWFSFFLFACL